MRARSLGQYAVLLSAVVGTHAAIPAQAPPARENVAIQTEMRNVNYHFSSTISVSIRSLDGELLPLGGEIPVFDDKRSFIIRIRTAEIGMAADTLARVLNQDVFSAPDAPIKAVSVTTENGRLKIKGKLSSKGNISFELQGTIAATPDGKVRIHATKVRAAHIPAKGLMDLLGLKISDLVKTNKVRGVRAEEDDLILDPEQVLPPPAIRGRVTAVRIQGNNIIQVFGTPGPTRTRLGRGPRNYMAYRGASLRFGKLTMSDTDLQLIDMDPRDAFDFYLDHYKEQLVAGYTKTAPQFGLRVFMPDYSKLGRLHTAKKSPLPAHPAKSAPSPIYHR